MILIKPFLQMSWRRLTGHHTRMERNKKILDAIRAASSVKYHLGCGTKYYKGYTNVDAFCDMADLKSDIRVLSDIKDATVDLVESHHVLEHLSFYDAEIALQNWARVIRPGGHIIISVPDMNRCCRLWLSINEKKRWGPNSISRMFFGSQEHEGMFHKSGYTPKHLSGLLQAQHLVVTHTMLDYPQRPTPSFLVLGEKAH